MLLLENSILPEPADSGRLVSLQSVYPRHPPPISQHDHARRQIVCAFATEQLAQALEVADRVVAVGISDAHGETKLEDGQECFATHEPGDEEQGVLCDTMLRQSNSVVVIVRENEMADVVAEFAKKGVEGGLLTGAGLRRLYRNGSIHYPVRW